jgi:hypothetical protein
MGTWNAIGGEEPPWYELVGVSGVSEGKLSLRQLRAREIKGVERERRGGETDF